ncbi:hypothetical protein M0R45_034124 [Rubus argutus]|uniref:Uncharacterized protein n=1 Tax=Rubus argutus TaxID=59490 RepID=A0AAW1VP87_RUBAR
MGVMEKLKIFVVQEPVVAASCLIAGVDKAKGECECEGFHLKEKTKHECQGDDLSEVSKNLSVDAAIEGGSYEETKRLFLPAVVRPMLDSFEASKQVPQPALSDVSVE